MPENQAVKVPFYKQKKFQAALLGAVLYFMQAAGVNVDMIKGFFGLEVPAPCSQQVDQ